MSNSGFSRTLCGNTNDAHIGGRFVVFCEERQNKCGGFLAYVINFIS